jgi:putative tricarboxylic transport membrane protein
MMALPAIPAWSAAWQPDKPVEMIIGTAPGGSIDATGRQIAKILETDRLVPTTVVVTNRPGAGNAIAWPYLNQHAGSGDYLSIAAAPLLTNPILGKSTIRYTDVTPLTVLFSEYVACSVRPDSPIRDGRDLIERLRRNPESLSISIATTLGANNHIAAGTVFRAAGIDLRRLKFVVFKSSGKSMTAMMGGHVDVDFSPLSVALGNLEAGRIRVLGITSPHRMPGPLSSVPTWTEQGYKAVFSAWRGVIGPKDMPAAQIAFWNGVFRRLSESKEWSSVLATRMLENTYMDSGQTRAFLEAQDREMRAVLGEFGLAK